MSNPLRIKLDRTLCDGFGICAKHAPEYFSLDDWGYAVLVGDGTIPEQDRDAVRRALLDCPVHAILEIGERRPDETPIQPLREPDLDQLKTEDNEAEWGFTR
ncbi:ferredoxin [Mycobacterium sp. PO1]|nr:ferredoxin [Mycobacterium sp. PO1]GFM26591.1 ferredoxin [Mycobacterium sp. PO2]